MDTLGLVKATQVLSEDGVKITFDSTGAIYIGGALAGGLIIAGFIYLLLRKALNV